MANTHETLAGLFTDIADAIREKTGGIDNIVADNFPEAIAEIETCPDDALFLKAETKVAKMPNDIAYTKIVYGNGKFVAIKYESDAAAYSMDGITWTATTMPCVEDWRDLIYADDKFVALGLNTAAYSTDGITWVGIDLPINVYYSNFIYANGMFVKLGVNKAIYSYDGITWEKSTMPHSGDEMYDQIAYGNGTFVAVAPPNKVAYSTDCITWTATTMPITIIGLSNNYLAYGDDKFVAMTNGEAAYSYDGITWNATTVPYNISSSHCEEIIYANCKFVAIFDETRNSDAVVYSSDGITWTATTTMPITASLPATWTTLVYANNKFVTTASNYGIAAYSYDGITWNAATMPNNGGWNSVAYDDSKFIAISGSDVAISYDGINWTSTITDANIIDVFDNDVTDEVLQNIAPDALFLKYTQTISIPNINSCGIIAYGNGKYVALSYEDSDQVAYSNNGIDWIASTLPFSETWSSVVYGNDKFVLVSNNSSNIAYSYDGITWVGIESAISNGATDIVYGNNIFVAIKSSLLNVFYSSDGISWTAASLSENYHCDYLAYGNGTFVAVGFNTDISIYSTDGITWNTTTMPSKGPKGYWADVIYANGVFVAIDEAYNEAAYSEDGITWSLCNTILNSNSNTWNSLTYGNGRFVAVGYTNTRVAYSDDAITWAFSDMPSNNSWHSVTYGNGRFVAIGQDSNSVAISKNGIDWDVQYRNGHIANASNNNVTEKVIQELGWAGCLTFSGSYATSEYFTESGCSLAVDRQKGMAFVTIQGGTSTLYENVYFYSATVPDGVTFLQNKEYGGHTSGTAQRYFTAAFTGITGKINVNVDFNTIDSSYDYVRANITMTYA